MSETTFNFEEAFDRLEEILNKMNSGKLPLDESLALYEEANQLIIKCSQRLNAAEAQVELLIKKRNGELELDAHQIPKSEPFHLQDTTRQDPTRMDM